MEPRSRSDGVGAKSSAAEGERVVLASLVLADTTDDAAQAGLDELARLVSTAGGQEVGRLMQHREVPDDAWFLGKGKVDELRELCDEAAADTVVLDNELRPSQQHNLEQATGRRVVDRTGVILDIFAQNAHSAEGKLQVELALLRYRLPRLRRGASAGLSQQGAGIGTRGPGETQLEVDRRRIMQRISKLEHDLADLQRTRDLQRNSRSRSSLASVTIVGYTNAGKSTLLNALTHAGVLAEDRLFATLDPTTRRLSLPGGETVLLTGTVGFVRQLPHGLVEAFKSTLEVARDADLLVHLVDATSEDPDGDMRAVHSVLDEVGAAEVPQLLVVNKVDRDRDASARVLAAHARQRPVAISAVTGEGLDGLLHAMADRLHERSIPLQLFVPYERGDVLASIHRDGEVSFVQDEANGVRLRVRLPSPAAARLQSFVVR